MAKNRIAYWVKFTNDYQPTRIVVETWSDFIHDASRLIEQRGLIEWMHRDYSV